MERIVDADYDRAGNSPEDAYNYPGATVLYSVVIGGNYDPVSCPFLVLEFMSNREGRQVLAAIGFPPNNDMNRLSANGNLVYSGAAVFRGPGFISVPSPMPTSVITPIPGGSASADTEPAT